MKIRTKMWLFVVISAILSVALFLFLSNWMGNIVNKGYDWGDLNGIAQTALDAVQEKQPYGQEQVKLVLDPFRQQYPTFRFEWIDSEGKPIYDSSGLMTAYQFKDLADRMLHMPSNLWTEGKLITLTYSMDLNGTTYYLLMTTPSEAMQPGQIYFFVRSFKVLFTFAIPFLLAFSVPYLLYLGLFSSFNRRISRLNRALNQVNLRSDNLELADKSKDEIGQLTRHFNTMTQRIRAQVSEIDQFEMKRKLLMSNLSHDLRTPLTTMLGYAETILTGHYVNEQELKAGAKIILQRSRYMDKLLDQMLNVSVLNSDDLQIRLVSCSLSELLRRIAADYIMILDGQDMTFEADIPDDDVVVAIDATLVERAVRNMLDNAVRYGKEGRYLGLSLQDEKDSVCISVIDRGKGLNPEEQKRVFERFYRVGARKGEGLGIGLSIVKEIAEMHAGSARIESIPHVETRCQMRLPKGQKESRSA